MSPGKPSQKLKFTNLRYLPNAKHFPGNQIEVDTVNRTMQTYLLCSETQLFTGDIIRKKKV